MRETAPIRPGEELNIKRLASYLRQRAIGAGELTVEQFPAGSSNLTYLVHAGADEYVLRRPPFGNTVKTAHDMRREFEVLTRLSAVYPPAPKPLIFCDDGSVTESDFYLMERRKGLIIRGTSPTALADSPTLQRRVCESFIQNLVDLHSLNYDEAGLGALGHPAGYVRRQVEGWTKRYHAARTHDLPELERAIAWLNAHIPDETGAALIHNDYKFDNIMLDTEDLTQVRAVLDWEMVTVGDPLMDVGTTLGYWMSPDAGDEMLNMPFNPRLLMENISRSELVEMYTRRSRRDVSNIVFYYVFGTFKIAVIAQQIYSRYAKGLTKDARFARFDLFVASLGKLSWQAVQANKI